jgi:hypothetical protein
MVRSFLSVCAAVLCVASAVLANPVISEFMADNTVTVRDEDGAYSDWIEVHNPTAVPIDLTNWCLTDDASALSKWRFPAMSLGPGDFVIVWASGKNRRISGAPLHTNFSLAAGGEYLALVSPNGATVVHQFSPAYPPQNKDESFGLLFSRNLLVGVGAATRYQVPTSGTLGTSWTASAFDHSSWAAGKSGLGYGLLVPGITVRSVKKDPAFGSLTSLAQTLDLLAQPSGSLQILADVTVIAPVVNFLERALTETTATTSHFQRRPGRALYPRTGTLVIPTAGVWTFGLNSDDGGRIRITDWT